MPDIEITCAGCGTTFSFTEKDQEFYTLRNLSHPKRCKPCRDARKERGGFTSDKPRFDVVCTNCGKTDSVPFKPKEGRPILCSECFQASRAR